MIESRGTRFTTAPAYLARFVLLVGTVCSFPLCVSTVPAAEPRLPTGNTSIRGRVGSSEIVITTTARLAGAVHSLTWNGKEFIDSHDHGRQLQSACSFGIGSPAKFWAEAYNPTEAGSRADGAGPTSSSKLLRMQAQGAELRSTTQMAFWLAPGEKSSGHPARNTKVLSEYRLSKHIRIGYKDWPNVLEYTVTFHVPKHEEHPYAQFEALTGYMPAEFRRFWTFVPQMGKLRPLDDGPGEQHYPVVFSTTNGGHAMGIYSPDQPSKGYAHAGYGRFRFEAQKVVKWNCVFRLRNREGVPAGEHTFRMFVLVGSLKDVRATMTELHKALLEAERSKPPGKPTNEG